MIPMMKDAIRSFNEQFSYTPEVERPDQLQAFSKYLICGMGGSHLAADILQTWKPELDIVIHKSYDLPPLQDLNERLVILSSYSGNTEEVVSAGKMAIEKGLSIAVVATGGKLKELATEHNLPYVELPSTGIQPRSALGYSLKGLLALMGLQEELEEVTGLTTLAPSSLEEKGKELAAMLKDHVPVIYSSESLSSIAYNWKIKFNETGKIPAFYNIFPELNHNEMTGFDIADSSKHLSERFYVIIIKDENDHPRILKRMEILSQQYKERGLRVYESMLTGSSFLEKAFNSLILADWAAVYTAQNYGLESEQVPMVEEFKKLIG